MRPQNNGTRCWAIRILSGGLMVYGSAAISTHADGTSPWTPTGTRQADAERTGSTTPFMDQVRTAHPAAFVGEETPPVRTIIHAPDSGPAWINTPPGERVRLITRFEADAIGGSGAWATGGATGPGGACTCDSQCAAAAGECRMAHCVGGVCVQSFAPVDTGCNFEGGTPLFCTEDRCNDAGVCIDMRASIGGATRLSPCAKQCCLSAACTAGSFLNCFEVGDCPGMEGCFLKRQAFGGSTYVAQCDETNDRCFVSTSTAPTVPVGRCCSPMDVCSITTEAACTAGSGRWLRLRDPDDVLHACHSTLGCPKYSSGIAPVDDPAMQTAMGPIVPFARRCAIGGGLCEVNADCVTRCNGGPRLNETCDTDADCPGSLCQPGGALDLCSPDPTECQLAAPSFNSIGDDYALSDGSYLRLSEFRFRGGASEPNEIALFEFYDSSFSPPRLANSFAFRFDNPGVFDYRIIVDCSPNCDPSQWQGTVGEEDALDPPFIIPPAGFVVMRATRLSAVLSPISPQFGEDDGNLYWFSSISAPDVGANNPNSMWINGVVSNYGALALDVMSLELLGEKLTNAPLAACCDPATGSCTQKLEWDCMFCTDPARTPCVRQRDCGLHNEFTCNSRDWKGARTRDQVNSDAYRDCTGRYCFDPSDPNPVALTPCTGTGQGTCAGGQTCESPCEKAACCVAAGPNAGCNEVTTVAECMALGGNASDVVFGQRCTPNCCPQVSTGVDCCKDYFSCHTGAGPFVDTGTTCNFRCNITTTFSCTADFECPTGETCDVLPDSQADCPVGQTCRLVCDGPDSGADPRIHEMDVPTIVNGTEQVVVDFGGVTSAATYFDDCAPGGADFGWYEMFTIGKADVSDACAVVTLNFCCSDPPISPASAGISRGCPCAGAETIFPDTNSLGQQAGFGSACNNDFCCTDGNYSVQWTLPAGTFVYGIAADKSCSNSTQSCYADADCDPGAWCRRNNAAYKGHLVVEPCAPGACCGAPGGGVAPFCSVTDQFTCNKERKYCRSNQGACADSSDCPVGDFCLPGVFLGDKEVNPVPVCDGDPCTLGACCVGPGNCVDSSGAGIDFAACAAQSGTFIGGFRCSDNPCPVCPIETQDQCQTATTGQFILPNDRIIGHRRADDLRPAGSVIRRICFFPCFIGVTGTGTGFECSAPGETPPDSFFAKFYEDDFGKPGSLLPGVPVNGFNLVPDAQLNSESGSRCWRKTAPINPPSGLTVTPGDCLWLEVTGLGSQQAGGLCLVHALSSADGNNYSMRDVNNNYELSDFDKNDLAFCIDSGIIGATSPPLSQDGGCGNFPVACCRGGSGGAGQICLDGGTYTQCVGTNQAPVVGFPFPYITCAQLATMGGCPHPANDDCADATVPTECMNQTQNPNLGVCSISEGPPNINEVCDMLINPGFAHKDCASTAATCGPLPVGSVGYRCQFTTDNRLASTDGPNTQGGPEPTCFASGINAFQADIWFKYIAPCNGYMTVHSCGPNKTYDSLLQVFSADTPVCVSCPIADNNQSKGCSDDNCGTNSSGSALRVLVTNGACYTIRMGGWSQLGSVTDGANNVSGLDLGVVCQAHIDPSSPAVAPAPHDRRKNRYISFAPNNGLGSFAFRVQRTTAPTGSCWVQAPVLTPGPDQYTATCGANPIFRVWSEPVIHVGDCEIIPVANYTIFTNVAGPIENPMGLAVSTILLPTGGKWWGDNVGSNNGTEWTPPNQIASVNDIVSILAFIQDQTIKPQFTVANLQAISSADSCLNAQVNTSDVLIAVRAVAGDSYGPPSSGKFITFAQCAVAPSGVCPCCGN